MQKSPEDIYKVHFTPRAELLKDGVKFDQDKPRMDLIPPETVEALAAVLTYGAKKYEDRNWEKGMSWGRVYGALMRHLFGEFCDWAIKWSLDLEDDDDDDLNE